MRIRRFEENDREAVISLWERCGLIVPWNDPSADIDRKIRVHPELFLIGEEDQEIMATAMGGYDGHRGWVYYLAVAEDRRGRGCGRKMIDYLADLLKQRGCAKFNVMVRSANLEVIDFYGRAGFTADEVVCLSRRLIEDSQ